MSDLPPQPFKTLEWVDVSGVSSGRSNEDDLGPEAAPKHNPLALVSGGDHLSPLQLADLAKLQADFADVFSPLPGRTDLVQHHIETLPREVACSRPYRLPEHKKNVVREELKAMLDLGVIEESHSDWASPIVLVPKTDGSVRFCVDYRKVNAVSTGECRRLSNAPSWRVAWSVRCGALLFDTVFNERVLADPLVTTIQRKDSLHHTVRITPIRNAAVRLVRGSRHLSAPHGQSPPATQRVRRCLSVWHHHP